MVVLLTYGLCPRKKPVSHLTSAARLACSSEFRVAEKIQTKIVNAVSHTY